MRTFLTVSLLTLVCSVVVTAAPDDTTPYAQGEYEIRLNGERIGQQQFRILPEKRPVVEITHILYYPEPSRREMRFELEKSYTPRKLEVVATRGGIVTELTLERKGDNWRAEVDGQGRKKKRHELGRLEGTFVDFDSPLFDALALAQLQLNVGQTGSLDAITLALPDFFAARETSAFSRVEDEDFESEVMGRLTASVFEQSSGGTIHRLWLSPSGVVLRETYEQPGNDEVEIVLKRLRTEPGKGLWP